MDEIRSHPDGYYITMFSLERVDQETAYNVLARLYILSFYLFIYLYVVAYSHPYCCYLWVSTVRIPIGTGSDQ